MKVSKSPVSQSQVLGLSAVHCYDWRRMDVVSFQVTLQSYSSSENSEYPKVEPHGLSCTSRVFGFPRYLSVTRDRAQAAFPLSLTPPSFPIPSFPIPSFPLAPLFILRDGRDRLVAPYKHIDKTADAANEQESR